MWVRFIGRITLLGVLVGAAVWIYQNLLNQRVDDEDWTDIDDEDWEEESFEDDGMDVGIPNYDEALDPDVDDDEIFESKKSKKK